MKATTATLARVMSHKAERENRYKEEKLEIL